MLVVGLTGGMGSGKSTVATLFSAYEVPIIDSDEIAHALTAPSTDSLAKIVAHFGKDMLRADGTLNRALLRDQIFEAPDARHWLEALLHPLIMAEIKRRLQAIKAPYAVVVIPLLAETPLQTPIDRVLVVDTDPDLQIQRIQARDHLTIPQIKAILQTQCTRQERLRIADDVIVNTGDHPTLQKAVFSLHEKYRQWAK